MFVFYLVVIVSVGGSMVLLQFSLFDKETKIEPSVEADVIVGDGLLAALEEDPASNPLTAAQEAVATAVSAAHLGLQDQALDAVTETAANRATEAAATIRETTTDELERSASALAETASRDEIAEAVAEIIDSTIEKLELDSGTLGQQDVVSDATAAAVVEVFSDEDVQLVLLPLGLTDEEKERLQSEAATELASNLVTGSEEAAQLTIEDLPQAAADALLVRATQRLRGIWEKIMALFGSLGIGSLISSVLVVGFNLAVRRPVVKLEAETNERLRYAVAVDCTIESARVEKPVSLLFNDVYEEVRLANRTFPFHVAPGSDHLTFIVVGSYRRVFSWNARLWWWTLFHEDHPASFCALRVNGNWRSYPIKVQTPSVAIEDTREPPD